MTDRYQKLLARQRDRAIAIILDCKERECDGYLPNDVSRHLRKVVLDQLNDFTLFCADILESVDEGTVALNEIYLQRIDTIFEQLSPIEEDGDEQ